MQVKQFFILLPMTRDEQLVFCKKCTNRKMDPQSGLLCELSGRKANFIDECTDYNYDTSFDKELDDEEPMNHSDVLANISNSSLEKLKKEQNFNLALIVGISAGILGALLWGVVTVVTGYQIGYMAVAVGAGVGISMRYFGKGIDQQFGIAGGAIALISCVLGNFFGIIGFIAEGEGLGFLETLTLFDYSQLVPMMTETFSGMDILFYGIAAYEGYKLAFRAFTERELAELK